MTRVTVVKPYVWHDAMDERGVVHRVVSLANVMHLCSARCGLEGKWNHAKDDVGRRPTAILTWTLEPTTCMTCIVMEARLASA
jgi:hypothetical protein